MKNCGEKDLQEKVSSHSRQEKRKGKEKENEIEKDKEKEKENENENIIGRSFIIYDLESNLTVLKKKDSANAISSTNLFFTDSCTVLIHRRHSNEMNEDTPEIKSFRNIEFDAIKAFRQNWRKFLNISVLTKESNKKNISADDASNEISLINVYNDNHNHNDIRNYNKHENISILSDTSNKDSDIRTKINVIHEAFSSIISITSAGLLEYDYLQGGWKTGVSGGGISLESRILTKIDAVKVLIRELSLSWFMAVVDPADQQEQRNLLFQGKYLNDNNDDDNDDDDDDDDHNDDDYDDDDDDDEDDYYNDDYNDFLAFPD